MGLQAVTESWNRESPRAMTERRWPDHTQRGLAGDRDGGLVGLRLDRIDAIAAHSADGGFVASNLLAASLAHRRALISVLAQPGPTDRSIAIRVSACFHGVGSMQQASPSRLTVVHPPKYASLHCRTIDIISACPSQTFQNLPVTQSRPDGSAETGGVGRT